MIFDYEKEDYKKGLLAAWGTMNPKQKAVLINLYKAPNHTSTSKSISKASGYADHRGFNLLCKNVGPRFMRTIGKNLPTRVNESEPGFWRIWALMEEKDANGKWSLVMRPGLVEAINELGLAPLDVSRYGLPSTAIECQEILALFSVERDVRKAPDANRKGRFCAGWLDAAVRGRSYSDRTLSQLTWSNLGYRLGLRYGPQSPELIDACYDAFAQNYVLPHNAPEVMPDEIPPSILYREGAMRQIVVNAYERSREARRQCITHYGTQCMVCGLDFGERYGANATGFIHVHHLRQLTDIGGEYEVEPIAALRPVCPNCHAVIHMTNPPRSIEQVRELLEQSR